MKVLLTRGINIVTAERWKDSVNHTIKEEKRMWDLDGIAEHIIEDVVISLQLDSSTEDSTDEE